MASTFPASVDNHTELTDGVDIIQANDQNLSYQAHVTTQTFIGNSGAAQSKSKDILDWLSQRLPGIRLTFTDVTHLEASTGVIFGLNSGETIRLQRRNPSVTAIDTAADMDTGAIGNNLTYFVHAVFDATATTVTFIISLSATAPDSITTFQLLGGFSTDGSAQIIESTLWSVAGMRVVQEQFFEDGDAATGTTIMPDDNTIPVITEGDEYMTLPYLPKNSLNLLVVDVVFNGDHSVNAHLAIALFKVGTTNAIAAVRMSRTGTTQMGNVAFSKSFIAGTEDAITFKVRAGASVGSTTTFNGEAGTRIFGGVLASSIRVTEYEKA